MTCLFNFVYGVNHGGVMLPSEGPADLRQRRIRQLFDQVHGYLPRVDHLLGVALFLELRLLHLEPLRDRLLDGINRHFSVLHMYQVLQHLLRHLQVNRRTG